MSAALYRLWRLVRWLAGFAVFLVLVVAILLAGFALFNLQDSRFFLGTVWTALTVPQSPPPIAAGVLSSGPGWMNFEPASSKFSVALRRRFPLGSDAGAMREALTAQGFGDETELRQTALCKPSGEEISPTSRLLHCPPTPWQRRLHYMWGGIVCRQDLDVLWSADAHGRISQVVGTYGAACL